MNRGRSVIPRGFSRFYVLSLLSERPMTGKEIMDETEKRSGGAWRPSPGLVYPLLSRLQAEGLVEETEEGYIITRKGRLVLENFMDAGAEFERRFGALAKLFMFGGFLAQDAVDRLVGLFSMVREDISKLGAEQRARYRNFLLTELRRLEEIEGAEGERRRRRQEE